MRKFGIGGKCAMLRIWKSFHLACTNLRFNVKIRLFDVRGFIPSPTNGDTLNLRIHCHKHFPTMERKSQISCPLDLIDRRESLRQKPSDRIRIDN